MCVCAHGFQYSLLLPLLLLLPQQRPPLATFADHVWLQGQESPTAAAPPAAPPAAAEERAHAKVSPWQAGTVQDTAAVTCR